jgi:hypothetical protein
VVHSTVGGFNCSPLDRLTKKGCLKRCVNVRIRRCQFRVTERGGGDGEFWNAIVVCCWACCDFGCRMGKGNVSVGVPGD